MTGKVVIVEGPDGAGKTTLIENVLVPAGYVNGFHNGVYISPQKAYEAYASQGRSIQDLREGVCFDRSHISQAIYGPIMRGERFEDYASEHWAIDYRFCELRAVVVVCRGEHTMRNWEFNNRHKNEYVTKREQMEAIVEGYDHNISLYTKLPCISYSYETWDIETHTSIINTIEELRNKHYGNA